MNFHISLNVLRSNPARDPISSNKHKCAVFPFNNSFLRFSGISLKKASEFSLVLNSSACVVKPLS